MKISVLVYVRKRQGERTKEYRELMKRIGTWLKQGHAVDYKETWDYKDRYSLTATVEFIK